METAEFTPLLLIVAAPIGGLVAMLLAVVFDAPHRRRTPNQRSAALRGAGGAAYSSPKDTSTYSSPMDTSAYGSPMSFDTGSMDCGPIDCGSVDCGTSGCD